MAVAYCSVTLVDDDGRSTKRLYEMATQVLLADYIAAIATFRTALIAVTDLGIVRMDLVIPGAGASSAVTANANVDVGATFSGYIEDGDGKKASLKLPGVKPAFKGGDGTIPITGAIATWLALFEDADDFMLSDGEQIDTWIRGTLDR